MILNQVLSMSATFLQICKCNVKGESELVNLGITGNKLNSFKNMIQHQYGVLINENDMNYWNTLNDVAVFIENRIKSLF